MLCIFTVFQKMSLPHGVSNISVFGNSEQLVWPRDGVKVGAEAVVEVRVRLPDLLQHLHVQAQLLGQRQQQKQKLTKKLGCFFNSVKY